MSETSWTVLMERDTSVGPVTTLGVVLGFQQLVGTLALTFLKC